MKFIIVGTAGHIDHGKTALVKALTGIDADRLEEEKRRGITIDLGFAHLESPAENADPIRFGFVDVPGHERFVRNMLAGVGGIDVVLLVIAADEGIKPQTREHFDICRLLSIQRGITVLTKSDLVDSDTLDVVKLEVADFVRGSFLENAPLVPLSSLRGTGLEELKRELVRISTTTPARDSLAITRLPVDRVFTIKGFGTVVTGTLVAGQIRKEDELELLPPGRKTRVRGVEVHGAMTEQAVAGQRTAVNIVGVEKSDVARGMVLASPGLLRPSSRLDVKLSLLPSAKPLKNGARVHLHSFTAEAIATVLLHEAKQLQPANQGLAELRLSTPLLIVPSDRFIIRQFSPVVTIGGGVVLDAFPLKKNSRNSRIAFLSQLEHSAPAAALQARVARRGEHGLNVAQAIAETGWREDTIESLRSSMAAEVLRVGDSLISAAAFTALKSRVIEAVTDFHQRNPLTGGMAAESLRENVAADVPVFGFVLDALLREKRLELVGGVVRLPGRGVVMKDEESESRNMIEHAFASAGLTVPALKDVLAGLKIDKTRAHKIVTLLLREKVLVKISDDLVFHYATLKHLREKLAVLKIKSPKLDVTAFKELTGVSRKYAIPLLEYLDRERVTKRVGDARVIL
jgi:selenocysteine-specific elongation factor